MEVTPDYQVVLIPISEIYSDDTFNCRGAISPVDVHDLAEDIRKNKLQAPIAVQPAGDVKGGIPDGKTYRIIAGHRRFKAWSVLRAGWQPGDLGPGNVPCEGNPYDLMPVMVKTGLTEIDARALNLGENLKRKNLNIKQEAHALAHLCEAGVPRDKTAELLGMSSGWVQTRYYLLDLPDDLQDEAAAGLLNQLQIKQLYSLRDNREEQYAAVRAIKDAKVKGEKVQHVGKRKAQKTDVKKERKREEMFRMTELIAKNCGYGLHTRTLAWTAGEITTEQLFDDIREYCTDHNLRKPNLPSEF